MLNLVMAIIQLHLLNNQKSLYLMKSKSLNHSLILNQIYKSLKKMVKHLDSIQRALNQFWLEIDNENEEVKELK